MSQKVNIGPESEHINLKRHTKQHHISVIIYLAEHGIVFKESKHTCTSFFVVVVFHFKLAFVFL